jgi:predicted helicase
MPIQHYLKTINTRFKSGISREHSYRADLENLIRELVPGVEITNEPSNVTDCGNPDYVITKRKIPIGYIEAKDIGKDLNGKQYKEQFTRYKKALDNLIITDYIWFQFFQHGSLVYEIRIGEIEGNRINPLPHNFREFENLINSFCTFVGQTIKSSKKLAGMMAAKARLLQDILEKAITSDEETQENTSLKGQYEAFKQILIHDLKPKDFADIYAQTLAYGMFAARLNDRTLEDFSRQEAAELIPKSNPFLRKLFQYVAGYDIDERIRTTVDNLADVFRATDINALLHNFGESTKSTDPIIHFYETFLAEYDPKLRKSRGVWYTPEPVVNFIVRAVDDILKTEFGLPGGLADTSKTKIKVNTQNPDKRKAEGYKQEEREVHKVQILDPAAGTGTFLAEVVKLIYNNNFKNMQGAWSGYVEEHLIPRLNGFELLMASYAMAHLKLDMLLTETGYKSEKDKRFNIYLTNSLEEYHPDTGTLFSQWLSTEANEANHIKRETPVMVVLGNPPYAVSSTNKGEWIQSLIADYKKDLNEKKLNLDDDYIKFLRYGQNLIDSNGEGILSYISNNSFIDGATHRRMRESLLITFDKIYILNLHGDLKKKEISPDGSPDENVFDIMQGVTISIMVKTGKKKKESLGNVYHIDLYGKREDKYLSLLENSVASLNWSKQINKDPFYFFIPKDYKTGTRYNEGFSIGNLFIIKNSGVTTDRDKLFYDTNKLVLEERIRKLLSGDYDHSFVEDFNIRNSSSYRIFEKIRNRKFNNKYLIKCNYRPFEQQYLYYDKNIISRPGYTSAFHLINNNNYGIICKRSRLLGTKDFRHIFITNNIIDRNFLADQSFLFPLYTKNNLDQLSEDKEILQNHNLNRQLINIFSQTLNIRFSDIDPKTSGNRNDFTPLDILDYVYAVLHSPTYREKYKEFLKIDFPRVPYPKDKDTFWQLVKLGGELREIHLLESPKVNQFITSYPIDGDNTITNKLTQKDWEITDQEKQTGHIWINEKQYFDNIPLVAWEFYIGGYQPAQKWLKDRRGRQLSFEDILHYQKIIVALTETDRLMREIDRIDTE